VIDSHCHLQLCKDDPNEILKRAFDSGITDVIQVATDIETAKWSLDLSTQHQSSVRVHPTAGLYPSRAEGDWKSMATDLKPLLQSGKFVAVGEVGIDLYHDKSYLERQKDMLKVQLDLAMQFQLPLIFHIRHSFDEVHELIAPLSKEDSFQAVWHCFEGTTEQAQTMADLGWFISFSGLLTYKRNQSLRETAKLLPEECLLIETDSPYLSPHPYRKERNEPFKVQYVLECLAQERNQDLDQLEKVTATNTRKLFKLDHVSN
jgi:TatD DNase family protein